MTLSDARSSERVKASKVLFTRSIKSLEGSRLWLRRTRAYGDCMGETVVQSVAESVRWSATDDRGKWLLRKEYRGDGAAEAVRRDLFCGKA